MKAVAAALLGLCVIAADIGAQSRGRGRSAPPPESGDIDLAVLRDEDIFNFEQNGGISDKGLALILNVLARTASASGTAAEPDRTRAYLLRGLGRLERRDLIAPISRFLPDSGLNTTAHLALALTLRANASADEPDEEITRAVNSLVTTAPAAILGQLPYSTVDQFETAQGRLAAMLDDARGPRATAARGLEALARRNRKLGRLSDETLDLLKKGARSELPFMRVPDDEPIARESFAALMAAGGSRPHSSRRRSVKTQRCSAASARSRSSARARRSPMKSARISFARRSTIVTTRCATTRFVPGSGARPRLMAAARSPRRSEIRVSTWCWLRSTRSAIGASQETRRSR